VPGSAASRESKVGFGSRPVPIHLPHTSPAWGFVTVLNDPLIAKLKGLFSLTYAEAMLTQFAFFFSYFIFSIPAGIALMRFGYIRSIALGLTVMAVGCIGAGRSRYLLRADGRLCLVHRAHACNPGCALNHASAEGRGNTWT
jgi:hypothetical protein